MIRKSFLLAPILFVTLTAAAQVSPDPPTPPRLTHQVGLQVNELIRQVFNFSNSAGTLRNPYLATYSVNSTRSGWGVRIGVGYNYESITTDDGITRRTSKLNDLQARLGIEKRFVLSPKWSAGAGLDGVLLRDDDATTSAVRGFDTVTTVTNTKINSYGGGAMVWLRYHLTPHVLIGTESSFYYLHGQEESDIAITRRRFVGGVNMPETVRSSVDDVRKEGRLSIPVAFYLIVQF